MRPALDVRARYCARYCEENVWQLCAALAGHDVRAYALLIANASGRVAIHRQRRARPPGDWMVWDYHVVLAVHEGDGFRIYDADSTLPSPSPAEHYLDESFPPLAASQASFRPRFRVIDARAYHEHFASDRRHMRDARGRYHSPPPPWPAIGAGHNLDRLLDLHDTFLGEVVDLAGLRGHLV